MGGNSSRPFGYARIAAENTQRQFERKKVTHLNLSGNSSVTIISSGGGRESSNREFSFSINLSLN